MAYEEEGGTEINSFKYEEEIIVNVGYVVEEKWCLYEIRYIGARIVVI